MFENKEAKKLYPLVGWWATFGCRLVHTGIMKGFISYAHADLAMVPDFRDHLAATVHAYDIPFWADDAIRAGQHGDDRIRIAINTANVFLLPIDDWPKHRHGYDKARSEIEAAIQTTFGVNPAASLLHAAARANQDETPGPYWGSKAVALEASIAPSDADIAATTAPIVVNSHPPSRDAAAAFDVSARAWLANNPDPNWQGLDAAAHELAQVLDRPTAELADCVDVLWRAAVTLAGFLASDKQLRSIPFGNRQTLPDPIHRPLNTLIITLAPWVRRFPTARELDDATGAFLADAKLLQPAYRVIEIAEQAALITQASAQMLRDQRSTIESDGRQGEKAGSYYLRATRNLLLEAGRLLANRVADTKMPPDAEDADLIERARVVMADPDPAISEMIRSFTPDIGAALESLRADAGKPNFLRGENSDTPRPLYSQAQPSPRRPADFELQARDMILRGERPPVEWRPFIQALDFGPPNRLSTEGRHAGHRSFRACQTHQADNA